MRILVALVLSGALMVVGCGDDDNGSGGTGGTGGTGGSGATGGTGGTGGSGSMLSVEVTWEPGIPPDDCMQGTPSEYLVAVTPMNAVGEVTITGSVAACTPGLDSELNEINCPNNNPYPATVAVTDEGGGMITLEFTVEVCGSGSVSG